METTNRRTRRRYNAQQRQELIGAYQSGHLSQEEFVAQHGIRLGTFQQWLYRAKQNPRPKRSKPALREVKLPEIFSTHQWVAEVSLGGQVTVRLSPAADIDWAGLLLQKLRAPC